MTMIEMFDFLDRLLISSMIRDVSFAPIAARGSSSSRVLVFSLRNRPSDGDTLPLAAGQLRHRCVDGRNVDSDVVQKPPRGGAHRPVAEKPEPAATGVFAVEKQIVVHAQLTNQRQILEHGLDAVLACVLHRTELNLLALKIDAATVRPVEARQDLDQSRLAGAVVA